jgi:hypothetical protein
MVSMENVSYPTDADLAERLRRLVAAEPWTAMALIMMLTPGQWEALRSQRIFESMQRRLVKATASASGRNASIESPEDVAQSVLARLAEKDWLRTFIVPKGSPAGYLNGAMRFQIRDLIRSSLRIKNRRSTQLPGDMPQRDTGDEIERADMIDRIRQMVSTLPLEMQSALSGEYDALGGKDVPRNAALHREQRGHREAGIALLKRNLGVSD